MELAVGDLVFEARAEGPAEGELVLLLHGFPQTSLSWRNQLGALAAAGYQAVAPDQRGYSPGARPADVGEYRVERLVGDVLGFADELGVERFHLVGHDWGGAVAWQVAGRHPERLRTVTSVSTPHPGAFRRSIQDGEQRDKSSYILFFRSPEAEPFFLDNDAAGLQALYTASGLSDDAVEEYVRVLTQPGAMTGARGCIASPTHRSPACAARKLRRSAAGPRTGRAEMPAGQPYLLTRGPLPEPGFVYVMVSRADVARFKALPPLAEVLLRVTLRASRTRFLATPVAEFVESVDPVR